jgi:hypothetical protein
VSAIEQRELKRTVVKNGVAYAVDVVGFGAASRRVRSA